MKSENDRAGVSLWDVHHLVRDIARTHGVVIQYHFHMPMREGTGVAFTVRCAALRSDGKGNWLDIRGSQSPWPCNDHRTLSGLLFNLAHQLDDALTDDLKRAELAAGGQRRFNW